MDKEKLISGIIGGVVAGFSIGVGFLIAQRTMGKFLSKKEDKDTKTVEDAVKQGVTEGVKQAQIEQDAANFAAMNARNVKGSRGRAAMQQMNMGRQSSFMGFDGNPNKMSLTSDPLQFNLSPNSALNSF
jgi:hypothetical protein